MTSLLLLLDKMDFGHISSMQVLGNIVLGSHDKVRRGRKEQKQ